MSWSLPITIHHIPTSSCTRSAEIDNCQQEERRFCNPDYCNYFSWESGRLMAISEFCFTTSKFIYLPPRIDDDRGWQYALGWIAAITLRLLPSATQHNTHDTWWVFRYRRSAVNENVNQKLARRHFSNLIDRCRRLKIVLCICASENYYISKLLIAGVVQSHLLMDQLQQPLIDRLACSSYREHAIELQIIHLSVCPSIHPAGNEAFVRSKLMIDCLWYIFVGFYCKLLSHYRLPSSDLNYHMTNRGSCNVADWLQRQRMKSND